MLLRNTSIILITVFFASISTAQEIGPRQERAITPLPGTSNATAPWLNVVPEKRQYYVYKAYATPDIATQLDKPIASPAYRSLLSARGAAFRSGARPLRLAIDTNAIVDVGADRPDVVNTVALVDLARSPTLLALIRRELGVDETKNYVIPTLASVIAQDVGAPSAYAANDTLMVTVAAMDHSRVTTWRLENGKWARMSDLTAAMVPTRDPQALVKQLPVRRGRVYYQGYERVAPTQVGTVAPTVRDESMEYLADLMRRMQAQSSNAAAQSALAQSTNAEILRALQQKKASEQSSQALADLAEEAQANAPPATYMAYGKTPWCSRHCSQGECMGCCAAAAAAAHTTVHTAAFACHMSSDLCPWCHIGCAIMTAAMSTSVATMDTACIISCTQGTATPVAQGNPYHCPTR